MPKKPARKRKTTPKKKPKKDANKPAPKPPETPPSPPEESVEARREALQRKMLGEKERIQKETLRELDLSAPADEGPTESESSYTPVVGPHRRKKILPILRTSFQGFKVMLANRHLKSKAEREAYVSGLMLSEQACGDAVELLMEKYLDYAGPWAEEVAAGVAVSSAYFGSTYLNRMMEQQDADESGDDHRGTGSGEDDDPAGDRS